MRLRFLPGFVIKLKFLRAAIPVLFAGSGWKLIDVARLREEVTAALGAGRVTITRVKMVMASSDAVVGLYILC